MPKKLKVYTRYCKKCHDYYKTPFKTGRICLKCCNNQHITYMKKNAEKYPELKKEILSIRRD